MLISHSTAYQCLQCGDRRWGSMIRCFLMLHINETSFCYQFAAQSFSTRFWNQFESHLEMLPGGSETMSLLEAQRQRHKALKRRHGLGASEVRKSTSFPKRNPIALRSKLFTHCRPSSLKTWNLFEKSFWKLKRVFVFACPCGPWETWWLVLIWRKPITSGSHSALSSGTNCSCWNTLCSWFVWLFSWFEIAWLAWTRLNPSCVKAIKSALFFGGVLKIHSHSLKFWATGKLDDSCCCGCGCCCCCRRCLPLSQVIRQLRHDFVQETGGGAEAVLPRMSCPQLR